MKCAASSHQKLVPTFYTLRDSRVDLFHCLLFLHVEMNNVRVVNKENSSEINRLFGR